MVHVMGHRSTLRTFGCAAAMAGLLLAFPAGGLASSASCHTRGKTIAKSKTSRVYRYGTHKVPWVDGSGLRKQPAYYGCRFATGKARRLVLEGAGPDDLTLRGDYVAFTSLGVDGGFFWILLADVNLGTGKRMQTKILGDEDTGLVRLVLTTHGSIAWSTQVKEADPPRGEIHRAAFKQAAMTLDSGPTVDSASMTLKGSTIQWTRGGVLQTAPLVP